jgi:hypothetical protein
MIQPPAWTENNLGHALRLAKGTIIINVVGDGTKYKVRVNDLWLKRPIENLADATHELNLLRMAGKES